MAEQVRETITTEEHVQSPAVARTSNRDATNYQTIEYLVYFMFGILETLLIFRFVLKLMGASSESAFVSFIYAITGILILPFENIFSRWFTKGVETTSVIEPATLIAIIVYGILAIGIVKLIRILSGKKQLAS